MPLAHHLGEYHTLLWAVRAGRLNHLASVREAPFGPLLDVAGAENCPYDDPAEKAPKVQHAPSLAIVPPRAL